MVWERPFQHSLRTGEGGFTGGVVLPYQQIPPKAEVVEAIVPLVRDAPFFHALDLNGAFRYTDYENSGGVNTWECDEMGHLNVKFWVAKAMEALAGLARELERAWVPSPQKIEDAVRQVLAFR